MAEIGIDLNKAKIFLEAGETVAIPTETVYGLAANAFNSNAIVKIFEVKNRPSFDPLIVHTDKVEKISSFVRELPEVAITLAQRFWPGPLTILFPKKDVIPDVTTSGLDTVAVRIPNHPLTLSLLSQLDFPLAAPSANPFGYVSPTNSFHVNEQLGNKIPYIIDGGSCSIGVESTIIGFNKKSILVYRLGGLTLEEIEKVIGKVEVRTSGSNPMAPGMSKSHYSPRKPFILGNIKENLAKYPVEETAILTFNSFFKEIDADKQVDLSKNGDLREAAQNLFSAMRALDKLPVKLILAQPVPEIGIGRAINDRLRRAAAK